MCHVWTAPIWQGFFEVMHGLVGAAMCPACCCGACPWPLAIMLSADAGPGHKHAVISCSGTNGVSWSVGRLAWVHYLIIALPKLCARDVSRLLVSPPYADAGSGVL
jgi:hypothetical protein